ncbi:FliH/SctL family protein [Buchnera aphidicola]|uniref:Flagellar assembly protein FliH n=1 Tax=Buchnera aphidicola (Aphis aurantii) TaxID=1470492 RepID=A0AAU6W4X5_9GAMM
MSNLDKIDKKNEWKKWYPEEVFLRNVTKNYNVFWNRMLLKETDFFSAKKNNQLKQSVELQAKTINDDKSYFLNIKKKLKEEEEKYIVLNNDLKNLCLNFESSLLLFEKTLLSRLLKTVLIVSSYIIGEKISINEPILLKKINQIIKSNNLFLKKPQLIVHPTNKKILEKFLKKSKNNKWELVLDKNVEINSFKIQSDYNNIDATIYARWKEVYRVILEEEKHS